MMQTSKALTLAESLALQQKFAQATRSYNQSDTSHFYTKDLEVYRDLYVTSMQSFINDTFRVLPQVLTPRRWAVIVKDFYQSHQSHQSISNSFYDISQSFLVFLETHQEKYAVHPAYISLAYYERALYEVGIGLIDANVSRMNVSCQHSSILGAHFTPLDAESLIANNFKIRFYRSQYVRLLRLDYDASQISQLTDRAFIQADQFKAESIFFLVYPLKFNVQVLRLNHMLAALIKALAKSFCVNQLLTWLQRTSKLPEKIFMSQILDCLNQLLELEIIYYLQPNSGKIHK